MATAAKWEEVIKLYGGKISEWDSHGGTIYGDARENEHVDGSWFDSSRNSYSENLKQKPIRDRIAREMRKDGWDVKTTTNSLGWFLYGSRKRAANTPQQSLVGAFGKKKKAGKNRRK